MLWTDRRSLIDQTYLSQIDSEVSPLAKDDDINLDDKISISCTEALMDLNSRIQSFSGGFFVGGDVSMNHIAAVMNTGTRSQVTQRFLPVQIVVSGANGQPSPVMRWIAGHTLYSLFRDAMNRGGKDRLKDKMNMYFGEMQRFFTAQLASYGCPIVMNPLSCPGAELEIDPGSFTNDNLSDAVNAAGTLDGVNVSVVVTYCDMSTTQMYRSAAVRNNSESYQSKTAQHLMTVGNVLLVDISTLNPPSGVQHPSTWQVCRITPLKATHWNLYVQSPSSSGKFILQNSTPIAIATKTYTLAGDPSTAGATPGYGQYEDRRLTLSNIRTRA